MLVRQDGGFAPLPQAHGAAGGEPRREQNRSIASDCAECAAFRCGPGAVSQAIRCRSASPVAMPIPTDSRRRSFARRLFVPILAGATLRERTLACLREIIGIALTAALTGLVLGAGWSALIVGMITQTDLLAVACSDARSCSPGGLKPLSRRG